MCFILLVALKIFSYYPVQNLAYLPVVICLSASYVQSEQSDFPFVGHTEDLIEFDTDRVCDLEQEQDKSQQLTIRQQRKGRVISGVCAVLLIVCSWAISLMRIQRSRAKQLQQEQAMANARHEQECLRLEQESERLRLQTELVQSKLTQRNEVLNAKSQYLHRILSERIELAKHVKQSMPLFEKGVPAWLQAYADRYLFVSEDNWQAFLSEFRLAYGNFIPYVQARYPALSDSDIQYIILAVLGMSNSDIAFVLGKMQRTVWNRRNTICMRAGISSSSLDEWAMQLPNDYIRSCMDTSQA